MTLTSPRRGLDRGEVLSTALAFLVSTALWMAYGHPYLARGVVGDLAGLGGLAAVLLSRRRRGRHEALACLAAIGLVATLSPDWPLRIPDSIWWPLIATAVVAYVAVRQRVLTDRPAPPRPASSAYPPAPRRTPR